MIKEAMLQEDITLVNIYTVNIGAPKYIKQNLMTIKGDTDSNSTMVEDFNTPETSTNSASRQKINKKRVPLNNTLDQMDLINIFRAFHPKSAEYTFFSTAHEALFLG